MLDWLRRLLATNTPRQTAQEQILLAQSQALIDLAKQQQATLDRIVAARYDRPFVAAPVPNPNPTMPSYMMDDQPFDSPDLDTVLTTGSDREFLESLN